jgi:hypothetical protein
MINLLTYCLAPLPLLAYWSIHGRERERERESTARTSRGLPARVVSRHTQLPVTIN